TVQNAAEQLRAEVDHHRVAGQHGAGVLQAQAVRALKDLDDAAVILDHDGAAQAGGAVVEVQLDHFVVLHAGHAFEHDQRAVDLGKTDMFKDHCAVPPSSVPAAASFWSISARRRSKPLRSSLGISYFIRTSWSNRPVSSRR